LVEAIVGLTKNGAAALWSTRRMHEESTELKARLDGSIREIASQSQSANELTLREPSEDDDRRNGER